jgi:3-oxoacyl-[acyl-carrier-protein] synthase-1
MKQSQVFVAGAGAFCPIGYCLPQIWASVRASMSQFGCPGPVDSRLELIRMAVVAEDDLEPLTNENEALLVSGRVRRAIRLATSALREATADKAFAVPPPLFLGWPEPESSTDEPWPAAILIDAVAKQAELAIDPAASRLFPHGRAAFFFALDEALRFLASGRGSTVVVGGVDTYLDLKLLSQLDADHRILGDAVADGFVPGEGAGFVVLSLLPAAAGASSTLVLGVGLARDKGHRTGSEPARGEGLSAALDVLLATSSAPAAPVQIAFAGLNGEHFGAKEWGVAQLRHTSLFAPAMQTETPADCFGDLGAATGAVLFALAHAALLGRHRTGPALVWASSDGEERACAIVQTV